MKPKTQCKARTQKGHRCTNSAVIGEWCIHHYDKKGVKRWRNSYQTR